MPKRTVKKIYKVKKSKELEYENLVVKIKGLDRSEIKQLRTDLDSFLQDYLETPETTDTGY